MRALIAALALAACATPAASQAPSPLAPLAFLEGCWVGVFDGPNPARDERCYAWMHEGRQLRDTHEVIGAGYRGETIYAWDADAQQIVATYFASDGGYMTGVAVEQGGALIMRDGRYVGADGHVLALRSRWLRQGEGFVVETEQQREAGGDWRPLMRITYMRAEWGVADRQRKRPGASRAF
ncbi:MAG: hypothetical protein R3C16_08910 [Hyphomonadaceae bacterium]